MKEADKRKALYRPFLESWLETIPDGKVVLACEDVLTRLNTAVRETDYQRFVIDGLDKIPPLTPHFLTKLLESVFVKKKYIYIGELTPERRAVLRGYWA